MRFFLVIFGEGFFVFGVWERLEFACHLAMWPMVNE